MTAHLESMIDVARNPGVGIFYTMTGPQLAGMSRRGPGSSGALDSFTTELARAVELGEAPASLDAEATAALLVGAVREGREIFESGSVIAANGELFQPLCEILREPA